MKLCFVGGGKMAEALIGGLTRTGWASPQELGVVEVLAERRRLLGEKFPGILLADSPDAAADAGFDSSDLLVAVKPQHMAQVALDLVRSCRIERLLSIAAGIRIDALVDSFGSQVKVIRAMPNTPALVGQGAAAIAGSQNCDDRDLSWAEQILSSVGVVQTVSEADLDAVTGLSGSGPAYVFLLAEAMREAGIAHGLAAEVADALTRQTLLGAATLLVQSGKDPAELRANVSSPGGTTIAGITKMREHGFERAVSAGIAAAVDRSIELGSP